MIGAVIGHYRVIGPLGKGGMGEVFVAEDTRLGRKVALKIIAVDHARDHEHRERFAREARAVASLSHANIRSIYEFSNEGSCAFAAMELLEGETLRDRLRRGPLPPWKATAFAKAIADALGAAHQRGIVHRDLKPENIFLTADGQLKVLDFGIAHVLTEDSSGSEAPTRAALTASGAILGTVGYMAPEQLRGEKMDARIDIFAFGAVSYEMLAGRPPFTGASAADISAATLNADVPAMTSVDAAALELIVRRCLEKLPQERFQSARDLRFALDAIDTVRPPDVAVSDPKAAPGRRHVRAAVVFGVMLAIGLAAVYGISTRQAPGAASAADPVTARFAYKVAVLPFHNFGAVSDQQLASGLAEEIASRLSLIRGIGVISRTSADHVAGSLKRIRELGTTLGADYVIEGSVRWNRDAADGLETVRISAQLIRVEDEIAVWADSYDRPASEVFGLQGAIADKVVAALDLTLTPAERAGLDAGGTRSSEAYQRYLQALDRLTRADRVAPDGIRGIVDALSEAVHIDPGFAMAQARLSAAHSLMYRLGFDVTPARLSQARSSLEQARAFIPGSPWLDVARGMHAYALNDYDGARKDFSLAHRRMPGAAEPLYALAGVSRRQGRLEPALEQFRAAEQLDPGSSNLQREIGLTLTMLGRYEEAVTTYDRGLSLSGTEVGLYLEKSNAILFGRGDLAAARRVQEQIPNAADPYVVRRAYRLDLLSRDYRRAAERAREAPNGFIDQVDLHPQSLALADAYQLLGDKALAEQNYEEARTFLEHERATRPEDHRVHSALGRVYAALGRRTDAVAAARHGLDLCPPSLDAVIGPGRLEDLARVYVTNGDFDAAFDTLDQLLTAPGFTFSVRVLQLHPVWDPLRSDPRYSALLARHGRS